MAGRGGLGLLLRGFDALLTGLALFAVAITAVMAVMICMDVLLRFFFARPQAWVFYWSEYILIYSVFLTAPWLLREEGHVTVDLVIERLGETSRRVLGVATSILAAVAIAIVAAVASLDTWETWRTGVLDDANNALPRWVRLFPIPLGCALLSIQFLRRATALLGGRAAV